MRGQQKRGHCNQVLPAVVCSALGTHPPCCCHCQMLWAVPTCLITVTSQDPATRNSLTAPPTWAKQDGGASCMVYRWWGQTTTVTSDFRGVHGMPPLGVHERVPLEGPFTSEGTTEEGTVTEHYLLLLSLPWELTHSATATAKCSGNHLNLPKAC